MQEQHRRLSYATPHLWELRNLEWLSEPWEIPAQARTGCVQWIPARRWQMLQVEPIKRKRPNSAKAWPKRFPRKPRADGRKPNIPKGLLLSQRRPKKSKKVKRPNRNAPATSANVDSVDRGRQCVDAAQRLRAGRTLQTLRRLATMCLFHERSPFDAPHNPKPGRCATYQGNLCYIISIFKRRNVAMADVLPLHRAQNDFTMTATRADAQTCCQKDLRDIGQTCVQLQKRNLRKGRLLFRVIPPHSDGHAADVQSLQVYLGPLQSSDPSPDPETFSGEPIRVEPLAAREHKSLLIEGCWHQVVAPWRVCVCVCDKPRSKGLINLLYSIPLVFPSLC